MKKTVGIIGGLILLLTGGVGLKKRHDCKVKKAKAKDPNEDLMRTFEAFHKEAMKSNDTARKAVRLMNNLQDEMEQFGMDPMGINTQLEDSLTIIKVEA